MKTVDRFFVIFLSVVVQQKVSIQLLYIVFYYVTSLVNESRAAGTRYFRYM